MVSATEATGATNGSVEPSQVFTISIRGIQSPSVTAVGVKGSSIDETVRSVLDHDVSDLAEPVMTWPESEKSRLLALDLDRPEDQPPLLDEDVVGLFPDCLPQPINAWVTHDGGLRSLFREVDGVSAKGLAGTWHLLAPLGRIANWKVEVKCDSRHPKGMRGAETCGRVHTFVPSANVVFSSQRGLFDASDVHVRRWLNDRGLAFGRHGSEACPSCGDRPGSCNPCVVIDERGIHCFRCQQWRSWNMLLDDRSATTQLHAAARNLVHFPHQKLVLMDARPSTPEELLQAVWGYLLLCVNTDRLQNDPEGGWDGRIAIASSNRIDVVRSSNGDWLSRRTLQHRKVSADRTLKELPWALNRTRIDAALSSETLEGFIPIEAIPHSALIAPGLPHSEAIQVRRPPQPGEPPPVAIGSSPPNEGDVELAWTAVTRALPGVSRGYLTALLISILQAQRAMGMPPIICVTGATGTAKTATVHLAAGMCGTRVGDVTLSEPGDVLRQIGLHIEDGRTPLLFDEIGRCSQVYERLQSILRLNSCVTVEIKYANERTITVCASLVFAGSTLPRPIVTSAELDRRSVGFLLLTKAPGWDRHGDIANLRNDPVLRPHLDIISASIWWLLHSAGSNFNFRKYCFECLGAVTIGELNSDGLSPEGEAAAVRLLYDAFRNAPASQITGGTKWKGWIECTPGTANGHLLEDLVDLDGDSKSRFSETEELKRIDLSHVLGFEVPRLRLMVHRRNSRWLAKFEELGVLRGKGCERKDLPPLGPPCSREESNLAHSEPSTSATSATGATGATSATSATSVTDHDDSKETEI